MNIEIIFKFYDLKAKPLRKNWK